MRNYINAFPAVFYLGTPAFLHIVAKIREWASLGGGQEPPRCHVPGKTTSLSPVSEWSSWFRGGNKLWEISSTDFGHLHLSTWGTPGASHYTFLWLAGLSEEPQNQVNWSAIVIVQVSPPPTKTNHIEFPCMQLSYQYTVTHRNIIHTQFMQSYVQSLWLQSFICAPKHTEGGQTEIPCSWHIKKKSEKWEDS